MPKLTIYEVENEWGWVITCPKTGDELASSIREFPCQARARSDGRAAFEDWKDYENERAD